MKNLIIVFILATILFLAYHTSNGIPYNSYVSNKYDIFLDKIVSNQKIPKEIESINKKNSLIKNVYYSKISINYSQKINMRLQGEMAYEDNKIRLKINHILTGKEIDMGSNEDFFWFWSKRGKPPALYYAYHKNMDQTLLRTVLSPEWIINSLYFKEIVTKDSSIKIDSEKIYVTEEKIDFNKNRLIFVTLIDAKHEKILGKYLYNEVKSLLASTEYYDFEENIPKIVIIRWKEEGISISMNLENKQYNTRIDRKMWSPPYVKNKINLAE